MEYQEISRTHLGARQESPLISHLGAIQDVTTTLHRGFNGCRAMYETRARPYYVIPTGRDAAALTLCTRIGRSRLQLPVPPWGTGVL